MPKEKMLGDWLWPVKVNLEPLTIDHIQRLQDVMV